MSRNAALGGLGISGEQLIAGQVGEPAANDHDAGPRSRLAIAASRGKWVDAPIACRRAGPQETARQFAWFRQGSLAPWMHVIARV